MSAPSRRDTETTAGIAPALGAPGREVRPGRARRAGRREPSPRTWRCRGWSRRLPPRVVTVAAPSPARGQQGRSTDCHLLKSLCQQGPPGFSRLARASPPHATGPLRWGPCPRARVRSASRSSSTSTASTCACPARGGSTSPPEARPSSTWRATTWRSATASCGPARAALHAAPLPRRASPGDKVHQKRLPRGAPPWVETVRLHFPRYGLHADELCVTRLADVVWAVQMSTVEFHPWNSRRADTEKPDEWRIDLDPMPDAPFSRVRRVAARRPRGARRAGAVGWPKTSGGRGMHVYVRIRPDHGFTDVRRAALAFAREVERRLPDDVTTTWWRRDRDPDRPCSSTTTRTPATTPSRPRTRCAATTSARSRPRSAWDEVDDVEPGDLTIATVPARFAGSATCMPASTTPCSTSRRCSSGPTATRPRGRERRRPTRTTRRAAVMDLVVPPGPGLPRGLVVPSADLVERFSRSSGPGGQGVNTADSRVELELDVAALPGLTDAQRARSSRPSTRGSWTGGCSSSRPPSTGSSGAIGWPPGSGWRRCSGRRSRRLPRHAARRGPPGDRRSGGWRPSAVGLT